MELSNKELISEVTTKLMLDAFGNEEIERILDNISEDTLKEYLQRCGYYVSSDCDNTIDSAIENITNVPDNEEIIKDFVWKLSEKDRETFKNFINYYSVN